MAVTGRDSLQVRRTIEVDGRVYDYFCLTGAENKMADISKLPRSLKVLLENLLRHEDGRTVTVDDARAVADWLTERRSTARDRVSPRAGADAGFYRCPGGR